MIAILSNTFSIYQARPRALANIHDLHTSTMWQTLELTRLQQNLTKLGDVLATVIALIWVIDRLINIV